MLDVLYEDKDVLVVVKPAGIESQTSRRLEPDMVSEIKNYLHRKAQEAKKLSTGLSPKASTVTVEPYVGVIHRLDKPVRGVMVYAKNQKAAAHLSRQVQDGKLEKIVSEEVVDTNGSGHGALAGFLMQHGVEALICGGIGGGAQAALAEVGIKLYGGVSGEADAAVHALLAENLGFNPDVQCSHHNQKHGDGGHTCGSHGCGNHGCH